MPDTSVSKPKRSVYHAAVRSRITKETEWRQAALPYFLMFVDVVHSKCVHSIIPW